MTTQSLLMRFPASLQYLTVLRQAIHAFCIELLHGDANEAQVYQLQLAVSELVTNIIVHAYRDVTPGEIEMRVEGSDGLVTLDFSDTGKVHIPSPATLPDSEDLAEGGYGAFLIAQCVDRVFYHREDDHRNHWHLEKQLSRE